LLAYGNSYGDGASTRTTPILASQEGRYLVRVGGDGDYTLVLSEESPAPLAFGKPQSVSLGEETLLFFDGTAGQVRTLILTNTVAGFPLDLSVNGPDGVSIAYASAVDSQVVRTEPMILPRDGSYLVRIAGSGDGMIVLDELGHDTLPFDEPQVSSTRDKPLWSFQGQAGQIITISLGGASTAFDPKLTLLAADGSTIVENDDDGTGYNGYNAEIPRVVLPATGLYYVEAGRPNSVEPYTLRLTKAPP
jgi:hypothetical protein